MNVKSANAINRRGPVFNKEELASASGRDGYDKGIQKKREALTGTPPKQFAANADAYIVEVRSHNGKTDQRGKKVSELSMQEVVKQIILVLADNKALVNTTGDFVLPTFDPLTPIAVPASGNSPEQELLRILTSITPDDSGNMLLNALGKEFPSALVEGKPVGTLDSSNPLATPMIKALVARFIFNQLKELSASPTSINQFKRTVALLGENGVFGLLEIDTQKEAFKQQIKDILDNHAQHLDLIPAEKQQVLARLLGKEGMAWIADEAVKSINSETETSLKKYQDLLGKAFIDEVSSLGVIEKTETTETKTWTDTIFRRDPKKTTSELGVISPDKVGTLENTGLFKGELWAKKAANESLTAEQRFEAIQQAITCGVDPATLKETMESILESLIPKTEKGMRQLTSRVEKKNPDFQKSVTKLCESIKEKTEARLNASAPAPTADEKLKILKSQGFVLQQLDEFLEKKQDELLAQSKEKAGTSYRFWNTDYKKGVLEKRADTLRICQGIVTSSRLALMVDVLDQSKADSKVAVNMSTLEGKVPEDTKLVGRDLAEQTKVLKDHFLDIDTIDVTRLDEKVLKSLIDGTYLGKDSAIALKLVLNYLKNDAVVTEEKSAIVKSIDFNDALKAVNITAENQSIMYDIAVEVRHSQTELASTIHTKRNHFNHTPLWLENASKQIAAGKHDPQLLIDLAAVEITPGNAAVMEGIQRILAGAADHSSEKTLGDNLHLKLSTYKTDKANTTAVLNDLASNVVLSSGDPIFSIPITAGNIDDMDKIAAKIKSTAALKAQYTDLAKRIADKAATLPFDNSSTNATRISQQQRLGSSVSKLQAAFKAKRPDRIDETGQKRKAVSTPQADAAVEQAKKLVAWSDRVSAGFSVEGFADSEQITQLRSLLSGNAKLNNETKAKIYDVLHSKSMRTDQSESTLKVILDRVGPYTPRLLADVLQIQKEFTAPSSTKDVDDLDIALNGVLPALSPSVKDELKQAIIEAKANGNSAITKTGSMSVQERDVAVNIYKSADKALNATLRELGTSTSPAKVIYQLKIQFAQLTAIHREMLATDPTLKGVIDSLSEKTLANLKDKMGELSADIAANGVMSTRVRNEAAKTLKLPTFMGSDVQIHRQTVEYTNTHTKADLDAFKSQLDQVFEFAKHRGTTDDLAINDLMELSSKQQTDQLKTLRTEKATLQNNVMVLSQQVNAAQAKADVTVPERVTEILMTQAIKEASVLVRPAVLKVVEKILVDGFVIAADGTHTAPTDYPQMLVEAIAQVGGGNAELKATLTAVFNGIDFQGKIEAIVTGIDTDVDVVAARPGGTAANPAAVGPAITKYLNTEKAKFNTEVLAAVNTALKETDALDSVSIPIFRNLEAAEAVSQDKTKLCTSQQEKDKLKHVDLKKQLTETKAKQKTTERQLADLESKYREFDKSRPKITVTGDAKIQAEGLNLKLKILTVDTASPMGKKYATEELKTLTTNLRQKNKELEQKSFETKMATKPIHDAQVAVAATAERIVSAANVEYEATMAQIGIDEKALAPTDKAGKDAIETRKAQAAEKRDKARETSLKVVQPYTMAFNTLVRAKVEQHEAHQSVVAATAKFLIQDIDTSSANKTTCETKTNEFVAALLAHDTTTTTYEAAVKDITSKPTDPKQAAKKLADLKTEVETAVSDGLDFSAGISDRLLALVTHSETAREIILTELLTQASDTPEKRELVHTLTNLIKSHESLRTSQSAFDKLVGVNQTAKNTAVQTAITALGAAAFPDKDQEAVRKALIDVSAKIGTGVGQLSGSALEQAVETAITTVTKSLSQEKKNEIQLTFKAVISAAKIAGANNDAMALAVTTQNGHIDTELTITNPVKTIADLQATPMGAVRLTSGRSKDAAKYIYEASGKTPGDLATYNRTCADIDQYTARFDEYAEALGARASFITADVHVVDDSVISIGVGLNLNLGRNLPLDRCSDRLCALISKSSDAKTEILHRLNRVPNPDPKIRAFIKADDAFKAAEASFNEITRDQRTKDTQARHAIGHVVIDPSQAFLNQVKLDLQAVDGALSGLPLADAIHEAFNNAIAGFNDGQKDIAKAVFGRVLYKADIAGSHHAEMNREVLAQAPNLNVATLAQDFATANALLGSKIHLSGPASLSVSTSEAGDAKDLIEFRRGLSENPRAELRKKNITGANALNTIANFNALTDPEKLAIGEYVTTNYSQAHWMEVDTKPSAESSRNTILQFYVENSTTELRLQDWSTPALEGLIGGKPPLIGEGPPPVYGSAAQIVGRFLIGEKHGVKDRLPNTAPMQKSVKSLIELGAGKLLSERPLAEATVLAPQAHTALAKLGTGDGVDVDHWSIQTQEKFATHLLQDKVSQGILVQTHTGKANIIKLVLLKTQSADGLTELATLLKATTGVDAEFKNQVIAAIPAEHMATIVNVLDGLAASIMLADRFAVKKSNANGNEAEKTTSAQDDLNAIFCAQDSTSASIISSAKTAEILGAVVVGGLGLDPDQSAQALAARFTSKGADGQNDLNAILTELAKDTTRGRAADILSVSDSADDKGLPKESVASALNSISVAGQAVQVANLLQLIGTSERRGAIFGAVNAVGGASLIATDQAINILAIEPDDTNAHLSGMIPEKAAGALAVRYGVIARTARGVDEANLDLLAILTGVSAQRAANILNIDLNGLSVFQGATALNAMAVSGQVERAAQIINGMTSARAAAMLADGTMTADQCNAILGHTDLQPANAALILNIDPGLTVAQGATALNAMAVAGQVARAAQIINGMDPARAAAMLANGEMTADQRNAILGHTELDVANAKNILNIDADGLSVAQGATALNAMAVAGQVERAAQIINGMTPARAAAMLADGAMDAQRNAILGHTELQSDKAAAILNIDPNGLTTLQGATALNAMATAGQVERAAQIINGMDPARAAAMLANGEMTADQRNAILGHTELDVANAKNILNIDADGLSVAQGATALNAMAAVNAAGITRAAQIINGMDPARAAAMLADGAMTVPNAAAIFGHGALTNRLPIFNADGDAVKIITNDRAVAILNEPAANGMSDLQAADMLASRPGDRRAILQGLGNDRAVAIFNAETDVANKAALITDMTADQGRALRDDWATNDASKERLNEFIADQLPIVGEGDGILAAARTTANRTAARLVLGMPDGADVFSPAQFSASLATHAASTNISTLLAELPNPENLGGHWATGLNGSAELTAFLAGSEANRNAAAVVFAASTSAHQSAILGALAGNEHVLTLIGNVAFDRPALGVRWATAGGSAELALFIAENLGNTGRADANREFAASIFAVSTPAAQSAILAELHANPNVLTLLTAMIDVNKDALATHWQANIPQLAAFAINLPNQQAAAGILTRLANQAHLNAIFADPGVINAQKTAGILSGLTPNQAAPIIAARADRNDIFATMDGDESVLTTQKIIDILNSPGGMDDGLVPAALVVRYAAKQGGRPIDVAKQLGALNDLSAILAGLHPSPARGNQILGLLPADIRNAILAHTSGSVVALFNGAVSDNARLALIQEMTVEQKALLGKHWATDGIVNFQAFSANPNHHEGIASVLVQSEQAHSQTILTTTTTTTEEQAASILSVTSPPGFSSDEAVRILGGMDEARQNTIFSSLEEGAAKSVLASRVLSPQVAARYLDARFEGFDEIHDLGTMLRDLAGNRSLAIFNAEANIDKKSRLLSSMTSLQKEFLAQSWHTSPEEVSEFIGDGMGQPTRARAAADALRGIPHLGQIMRDLPHGQGMAIFHAESVVERKAMIVNCMMPSQLRELAGFWQSPENLEILTSFIGNDVGRTASQLRGLAGFWQSPENLEIFTRFIGNDVGRSAIAGHVLAQLPDNVAVLFANPAFNSDMGMDMFVNCIQDDKLILLNAMTVTQKETVIALLAEAGNREFLNVFANASDANAAGLCRVLAAHGRPVQVQAILGVLEEAPKVMSKAAQGDINEILSKAPNDLVGIINYDGEGLSTQQATEAIHTLNRLDALRLLGPVRALAIVGAMDAPKKQSLGTFWRNSPPDLTAFLAGGDGHVRQASVVVSVMGNREAAGLLEQIENAPLRGSVFAARVPGVDGGYVINTNRAAAMLNVSTVNGGLSTANALALLALRDDADAIRARLLRPDLLPLPNPGGGFPPGGPGGGGGLDRPKPKDDSAKKDPDAGGGRGRIQRSGSFSGYRGDVEGLRRVAAAPPTTNATQLANASVVDPAAIVALINTGFEAGETAQVLAEALATKNNSGAILGDAAISSAVASQLLLQDSFDLTRIDIVPTLTSEKAVAVFNGAGADKKLGILTVMTDQQKEALGAHWATAAGAELLRTFIATEGNRVAAAAIFAETTAPNQAAILSTLAGDPNVLTLIGVGMNAPKKAALSAHWAGSIPQLVAFAFNANNQAAVGRILTSVVDHANRAVIFADGAGIDTAVAIGIIPELTPQQAASLLVRPDLQAILAGLDPGRAGAILDIPQAAGGLSANQIAIEMNAMAPGVAATLLRNIGNDARRIAIFSDGNPHTITSQVAVNILNTLEVHGGVTDDQARALFGARTQPDRDEMRRLGLVPPPVRILDPGPVPGGFDGYDGPGGGGFGKDNKPGGPDDGRRGGMGGIKRSSSFSGPIGGRGGVVDAVADPIVTNAAKNQDKKLWLDARYDESQKLQDSVDLTRPEISPTLPPEEAIAVFNAAADDMKLGILRVMTPQQRIALGEHWASNPGEVVAFIGDPHNTYHAAQVADILNKILRQDYAIPLFGHDALAGVRGVISSNGLKPNILNIYKFKVDIADLNTFLTAKVVEVLKKWLDTSNGPPAKVLLSKLNKANRSDLSAILTRLSDQHAAALVNEMNPYQAVTVLKGIEESKLISIFKAGDPHTITSENAIAILSIGDDTGLPDTMAASLVENRRDKTDIEKAKTVDHSDIFAELGVHSPRSLGSTEKENFRPPGILDSSAAEFARRLRSEAHQDDRLSDDGSNLGDSMDLGYTGEQRPLQPEFTDVRMGSVMRMPRSLRDEEFVDGGVHYARKVSSGTPPRFDGPNGTILSKSIGDSYLAELSKITVLARSYDSAQVFVQNIFKAKEKYAWSKIDATLLKNDSMQDDGKFAKRIDAYIDAYKEESLLNDAKILMSSQIQSERILGARLLGAKIGKDQAQISEDTHNYRQQRDAISKEFRGFIPPSIDKVSLLEMSKQILYSCHNKVFTPATLAAGIHPPSSFQLANHNHRYDALKSAFGFSDPVAWKM